MTTNDIMAKISVDISTLSNDVAAAKMSINTDAATYAEKLADLKAGEIKPVMLNADVVKFAWGGQSPILLDVPFKYTGSSMTLYVSTVSPIPITPPPPPPPPPPLVTSPDGTTIPSATNIID